jgi:hypothetical protein
MSCCRREKQQNRRRSSSLLRPVNTRRVPGIITRQRARGSRDFVVLRQAADADIPDAMAMTKEEMIAP